LILVLSKIGKLKELARVKVDVHADGVESLMVDGFQLLGTSTLDDSLMIEGDTDDTDVYDDIPMNPDGAL
jgi:hypothetical protein